MRCLLFCAAPLLFALLFLAGAKEECVDKDRDEIEPLVRTLCRCLIDMERRRLSSLRLNAVCQYNKTKINQCTSSKPVTKPYKPSKPSATKPTVSIESNIQKPTSHKDSQISLTNEYKSLINNSNVNDVKEDSFNVKNGYNNFSNANYSTEIQKHSEYNPYSIDCYQSCEINEKYGQNEECEPLISYEDFKESRHDGSNPCSECIKDHKCTGEYHNVNSESCIDFQPYSFCNSDLSNQRCNHQICTNSEHQVAPEKSDVTGSEMCNSLACFAAKPYKQDSCREHNNCRSGNFQIQSEQYCPLFPNIRPEPFSECIPHQTIDQKLLHRCRTMSYYTTPARSSLTHNRDYYRQICPQRRVCTQYISRY